jgi:hypothetical protein
MSQYTISLLINCSNTGCLFTHVSEAIDRMSRTKTRKKQRSVLDLPFGHFFYHILAELRRVSCFLYVVFPVIVSKSSEYVVEAKGKGL